jgi:hypothetical protein
MVSHPSAGPQDGRCMYLMPLHVLYQKKTFESYALWVNVQVFGQTTEQFRRGIYNME